MQMYLADHQRVRLFIINLIYYLYIIYCYISVIITITGMGGGRVVSESPYTSNRINNTEEGILPKCMYYRACMRFYIISYHLSFLSKKRNGWELQSHCAPRISSFMPMVLQTPKGRVSRPPILSVTIIYYVQQTSR